MSRRHGKLSNVHVELSIATSIVIASSCLLPRQVVNVELSIATTRAVIFHVSCQMSTSNCQMSRRVVKCHVELSIATSSIATLSISTSSCLFPRRVVKCHVELSIATSSCLMSRRVARRVVKCHVELSKCHVKLSISTSSCQMPRRVV